MAQVEIVAGFGQVIGWNQHQAVFYGRKLVGIKKIMYKDNQEREAVMGGGSMPIGVGDGNYSAECSFTLLLEEVNGILGSAPPGTRLQDIPPVDIPILNVRNGVVKKDVIRNFQFVGQGKEVNQGDKSVWLEMPCFCTHIDWNVE